MEPQFSTLLHLFLSLLTMVLPVNLLLLQPQSFQVVQYLLKVTTQSLSPQLPPTESSTTLNTSTESKDTSPSSDQTSKPFLKRRPFTKTSPSKRSCSRTNLIQLLSRLRRLMMAPHPGSSSWSPSFFSLSSSFAYASDTSNTNRRRISSKLSRE